MAFNIIETSIPTSLPTDNTLYVHICEICDHRELLTAEEGFRDGWDYAPRMYPFKVIGPRTCGKCGVENTVWAELVLHQKNFDDLSEKQKEVLQRIYGEPESIIAR